MPHKTHISASSGTAFLLSVGQHLTVIDSEGSQVSDLYCVLASDRQTALSSGRSIDYNDTIRFTTGHKLYAFDGTPMLEIVADSCGVHDFLVTPCSLQMFQMLDPTCTSHASCQNNLIESLATFDVPPSVLGTTFNIFMNVPVQGNGSLSVEPPLSVAGDHIRFRALQDLIVGLTACADEGTNNGTCKQIQYCIE